MTEQKAALVTGAARRIGRAIALALQSGRLRGRHSRQIVRSRRHRRCATRSCAAADAPAAVRADLADHAENHRARDGGGPAPSGR